EFLADERFEATSVAVGRVKMIVIRPGERPIITAARPTDDCFHGCPEDLFDERTGRIRPLGNTAPSNRVSGRGHFPFCAGPICSAGAEGDETVQQDKDFIQRMFSGGSLSATAPGEQADFYEP